MIHDFSKKRTKFSVDRKPGENDFDYREESNIDVELVGCLVPTEIEHEFVYFGIRESGILFKLPDSMGKGDLLKYSDPTGFKIGPQGGFVLHLFGSGSPYKKNTCF